MKKINTIGMDMGDRKHNICVIDHEGEVILRTEISNTAKSLKKYFGGREPCLVAMEAGTHSAWISRMLEEMGYDVLVGNPRKLRMIWDSDDKCDDRDAEMLARVARFDRKLLYPIKHKGKEAQNDLCVIKSRDILVRTRTTLITHARGIVKSSGERISKCSTETFHKKARTEMPVELEHALASIIDMVEELTKRIRYYDKIIKKLSATKYSATAVFGDISGVGPITALAFVLTVEDYTRFRNNRSVGAFLGLVPKKDQSGQTDKQLGITKAGNGHLRRLLVGCAQYILGPFGPECDLRRFGLKLAARGGKNAKRRAVVAVARRLAVLMLHLWKSGDAYNPNYIMEKHHLKKPATDLNTDVAC